MVHVFFNYLRLFARFTEEDEALITAHLNTSWIKEGTVLLNEGRIARELFFICKGILKITTTTDKGTAITQFFLKENQFCTLLKSFNQGTPGDEGIVAACDSELVIFPREQLLKLYEQLPHFETLINNITHQALLDKIRLRNSYSGEDATARYQKFLLQQPEIALRVSLTDIASYLQVTPQSLSRIRRNIR